MRNNKAFNILLGRSVFRKLIISIFLLLLTNQCIYGQNIEQNLEERIYVALDFKNVKGTELSFSLSPELRLSENKQEYLINCGTDYKVAKFLELGGEYRFLYLNTSKKEAIKHYYSLHTKISHDINRFDVFGRVKFSSYTEDFNADNQYLRFKVGAKYNIYGSKFTPSLASEMFTLFSDGQIVKYRHSAGLSYKLNEQSKVRVKYRFDYFMQDFKNNHIVSLGYVYRL